MENVRGEGGGERRTGGGEGLNAVVSVLRISHIIINMGGMMSMDLNSLFFRYKCTSWRLAVDFKLFLLGVMGSQLHFVFLLQLGSLRRRVCVCVCVCVCLSVCVCVCLYTCVTV